MDKQPEDYRQAAKERIEQARILLRSNAYALAMYTAGVAVECTFRAYFSQKNGIDANLVTGHNIPELFKTSGSKVIALASMQSEGLSEAEVNRYIQELQSHIVVIERRWANDFRYVPEARLRAHLKRMLHKGEKVKGDFLKVHAQQLIEATGWIVEQRERLWILSAKR